MGPRVTDGAFCLTLLYRHIRNTLPYLHSSLLPVVLDLNEAHALVPLERKPDAETAMALCLIVGKMPNILRRRKLFWLSLVWYHSNIRHFFIQRTASIHSKPKDRSLAMERQPVTKLCYSRVLSMKQQPHQYLGIVQNLRFYRGL